MDERAMSDFYTLPLSTTLPICFLGGILLGYIYFCVLRETADMIVNQVHPLLGLILTLGRVALIVAGFYAATLAGALALLSVLAGVLCTKAVLLRDTRSSDI
jgi:hypothetical protein